VVSLTPRPLYPRGKSLRHPSDRRLGGPQSWSWLGGEQQISQPPPPRESNSRTPIVQTVASRYTRWATSALVNEMYHTALLRSHWSGIVVPNHHTTRCNNPENHDFYIHCCGNLRLIARICMGKQQCSGHISLTTHSNPDDGGSTVSERLVSNHKPGATQETATFIFTAVKTSNYTSTIFSTKLQTDSIWEIWIAQSLLVERPEYNSRLWNGFLFSLPRSDWLRVSPNFLIN
jgi:hypothetical protein